MFYNMIIGAILAISMGVQAGEVLLHRHLEHHLQHLGQSNSTTKVAASVAEQGLPSWDTMSWAEKAPLTEVEAFSSAEDFALTMTISKSRPAELVEPTEGHAAPEETKIPAEDASQSPKAENEVEGKEAPVEWAVSDFLAVGMALVASATLLAAAA